MSDEPKSSASFGPNVWLIDEMFREFKERPESVSESWREFFSDYRPAAGRIARAGAADPARPRAAASRRARRQAAPAAVPLIGPAGAWSRTCRRSLLGAHRHLGADAAGASLLEENRTLLNQHLAELTGGKVSFTHLMAWAIGAGARDDARDAVALRRDRRRAPPAAPEHVNLGLAVDVQRRDGTRGLVVPSIKRAETLEFAAFFAAYNDLIRKAQPAAHPRRLRRRPP